MSSPPQPIVDLTAGRALTWLARLSERRGLHVALSLILAALAVASALVVVPWPRGVPDATLTLTGSTGIAPGEGPVFALDEHWFPQQCGRAALDAEGVLRIHAYRQAHCRSAVAWFTPLLLPSDPRVPWALIPAEERQQLQALGNAALERMQQVLKQTVSAPFFVEGYLPVLEQIMRTAIARAMEARTVTLAVEQLGERLREHEQLQALLDTVVPVLGQKARDNLWRTLSSAAAALAGSDAGAQREGLTLLLDEVLADRKVRAQLAQTLPELLSDPASLSVGAAVAREAAQAAVADPRLTLLLKQLAGDPHFLALQPFGPEAEQLLTTLPQALLRMRHSGDHNPLATHVLRSQIRDTGQFLILLPNSAQAAALRDAGLPTPIPLRRSTP